jgi:hypothetical protein
MPSPSIVRGRLLSGLRSLLGLSERLAGTHPAARFLAILAAYAIDLGAAFWLAYELRWDFSPPGSYLHQCLSLAAPVVLCKLLLLHSFGQFRSVMSYFGLADFGAVFLALGAVGASMMGLWYIAATTAAPPRAVILMDFVLGVGIISAFRLSLRVARTWSAQGRGGPGGQPRRAAIVGAGDVGEALARDLLAGRTAWRRSSSSTRTRRCPAAASTDSRFLASTKKPPSWPGRPASTRFSSPRPGLLQSA